MLTSPLIMLDGPRFDETKSSAGQIVGMWIGPFVSDKLGRKVGMISLAGVLLIASPMAEQVKSQ